MRRGQRWGVTVGFTVSPKTVRSTGDTDAVTLELVLSGKAVALTFP